MKATRFNDMHSGGGLKEDFDEVIIEAPADEAAIIFYNRFGHNPHRVSCTCCGTDYWLTEYDSLEAACNKTDKNEKVLIIKASSIKDEERIGRLPEQGYVWKD